MARGYNSEGYAGSSFPMSPLLPLSLIDVTCPGDVAFATPAVKLVSTIA